MAAGAGGGRDKLTFVLDHRIATFGLWVEQLIAESTGKHGTGVLPVVGEPLGPPEVYGDDRLFVVIGELRRPTTTPPSTPSRPPATPSSSAVRPAGADLVAELGAQVLLWEVATALCGAALGINPFDQPDVAAAKAATQAVLDAGDGARRSPSSRSPRCSTRSRPGDYVAIHAYVDPGSRCRRRRRAAPASRIRDRLRVATTVGLGPRFLHSTGQLHKGGPPTGVFLQVVDVDDPTPTSPSRARRTRSGR